MGFYGKRKQRIFINAGKYLTKKSAILSLPLT
jgi:hypothetical protein